VDPRTGVDDVKRRTFSILPGLKLRSLRRPARSQSLYRLRYSGSFKWMPRARGVPKDQNYNKIN
jgi:hypothetical protein